MQRPYSEMLSSRTTACRGAFGAAPPRAARIAVVSRSYKNLENIDLSRVADHARHESDTGSSEYQVARLCARISQLSTHLQANKKDYAAKRGLQAILAQRKTLLQYIYRKDRNSYDNITAAFGIRSVIVGDTRGTTREKEVLAADV